jgi:hypothetical protein
MYLASGLNILNCAVCSPFGDFSAALDISRKVIAVYAWSRFLISCATAHILADATFL